MIFQEPMTSLNPCFTVGFQIMETLRVHEGGSRAERRRRTIELLDQVGIPEPASRLDAFPHQLSGGMSQRVMIAMAISCNPRLLIADEPTTALDVTIQAQILDLLLQLQRDRGMALALITHDMGVVAETAERIVVMYAGEAVEVQPAAQSVRAAASSLYRGLAGGAAGAQRRAPAPQHDSRRRARGGGPARGLPLQPALRLCRRQLPAHPARDHAGGAPGGGPLPEAPQPRARPRRPPGCPARGRLMSESILLEVTDV